MRSQYFQAALTLLDIEVNLMNRFWELSRKNGRSQSQGQDISSADFVVGLSRWDEL